LVLNINSLYFVVEKLNLFVDEEDVQLVVSDVDMETFDGC
jgi:hypothetical protein